MRQTLRSAMNTVRHTGAYRFTGFTKARHHSLQARCRHLMWLATLCLLGLGGCATQPQVEVYLTNIAPMPSTLFEQRVRLDLRVQNLSESPLRATGADVALVVNGRQLARGVTNTPLEVDALDEAATSIVVSSSVFDSLRQLLGLPGRTSFTYALKGKLFTSGLNKRFTRSGELTREDLGRLLPAASNSAN